MNYMQRHPQNVCSTDVLSKNKIKFKNIIKTKKYYTVGTIPKFNRKTAEKQNRCHNTHIHDCSLSWLSTWTF